MDPEIQRALKDGVPPEAIVAELGRRGLPVPPELQQMAQAAPQTLPGAPQAAPGQQAADALRTAAGFGLSGLSAVGAHPVAAGLVGIGAAGHAAEKITRGARATSRVRKILEGSGGEAGLRSAADGFLSSGRGDLPMLGDLSDAARNQADFVATHNPAARDAIAQVHRERQAGVPGRLKTDIVGLAPAGTGGTPAARSEIAGSEQAQAAWAASPDGFEGLRKANPIIKDPESFSRVINEPGNEPLRAAYNKVRAKNLLVGGHGAPSFDTMHQMARDVNAQITEKFKAGDGEGAKQLKAARQRLYDQMEVQVGDKYKAVTRQYRAYSQQQELLDEGIKFWGAPMQTEDVARTVKSMTPEELDIFRRGVTSGLLTRIDQARSSGGNEAVKLLGDGPLTQAKLELVFGSKATFDRFVSRLQQERALALAGGIGKGSQTAGRLSELADEAGAFEAGDVAHTLTHPKTAALKAVLGRIFPGPETFARGTAKELEPLFTAKGYDALMRILRTLPK